MQGACLVEGVHGGQVEGGHVRGGALPPAHAACAACLDCLVINLTHPAHSKAKHLQSLVGSKQMHRAPWPQQGHVRTCPLCMQVSSAHPCPLTKDCQPLPSEKVYGGAGRRPQGLIRRVRGGAPEAEHVGLVHEVEHDAVLGQRVGDHVRQQLAPPRHPPGRAAAMRTSAHGRLRDVSRGSERNPASALAGGASVAKTLAISHAACMDLPRPECACS